MDKHRREARESRRDAKYFRALVLERAKGKCEICKGAWGPILSVHHLVAVSEGGDGWADNLAAICPNCHAIVHLINRDPNSLEVLDDWIESQYSAEVYRRFAEIAKTYKRPAND